MKRGDRAAQLEAVQVAAMTAFRDVSGYRIIDDGDLLRTVAHGRPHAFLNGVLRLNLDAEGLEARVRSVAAEYESLGLPALWWLTPNSRPTDLGERLEEQGMTVADEDWGMVIDLEPWPALLDAAVAARPTDLDINEVATTDDLDAWIEVMALSYGWTDRTRVRDMADIYDPVSAPPAGRRQLLARQGGQSVAVASLFESDGYAWITNVGTAPSARGRGAGGAVTTACLALAAERGHQQAWLAASAMGRPVYRRLGFVDVGKLTAYSMPAITGGSAS